MRLVDDCKYPVGTLDGIRDEARVLDDEYLVLLGKSDHIPVRTGWSECEPAGRIQQRPDRRGTVSPPKTRCYVVSVPGSETLAR